MDRFRIERINFKLHELSWGGDGGRIGDFDGVLRGVISLEEGALELIERLLEEVEELQNEAKSHGY